MSFKKAERTQLYLRCALFGPGESDKTMSALRMAKGIAEKMGIPFAVIDTKVIDRPGEDFGVALYEWLMSGTAIKQETTVPPVVTTATEKPKAELKPDAKNTAPANNGNAVLKERSTALIKEIGDIVTTEHFTDDERDEARNLIKSIKLSEDGMEELETLKEFLGDELGKRSKKTA
jgi:hypothetical protein